MENFPFVWVAVPVFVLLVAVGWHKLATWLIEEEEPKKGRKITIFVPDADEV